jgi:hypothetical protein
MILQRRGKVITKCAIFAALLGKALLQVVLFGQIPANPPAHFYFTLENVKF